MTITAEHLISLIITLLIVSAVGLNAARKVKTADDFTVGGHSSGMTLVAGTIIGTIIGGASTIGTAQLAFSIGFSAWWFTLGAGIALLAMAVFYAKPLRLTGLKTIPEYLVLNYGPAAGPLTSLTSSVGIFFSIVASILAGTSLIGAIFSIDSVQAVFLVFTLVIVYVFFGGVWGTGQVGILKTFLTCITLVAVGLISYKQMGGVNGYLAAFPSFPWFSLFGRGAWVDIGSGLSMIVGTISTQTYIQALYAAKNVRAARNGAIIAALITLPTGIPSVMAGMFMRAHHPDIPPIEALPLFILQYLPPWLGGVAMATLLLAAVGSSAGLALGVGTMLSCDILAVCKCQRSTIVLWTNRFIVFLVTLAAAGVSFLNMESLVLDWNFLSMGLRGAGVFFPLTLAVFLPNRISKKWAVWSMLAGALAVIIWKIIYPQGFDPLYAGLIASAVFLAAGIRREETLP